MQLIWPLHLATMALFASLVFSLVAQQEKNGAFANWRTVNQRSREFQSKLLGLAPRPLRIACGVVATYALINFVLFMALMEGGSPSTKDGKYYLHNHGRMIRELTKGEYQRFRAYEVRGFSGHWMMFSIVPMTYFLAVHPLIQKSNPTEDEKVH